MKFPGQRNRRRRGEPRLKLPPIPWMAISSGVLLVLVIGTLIGGGRWLLNRPIERVVLNGEFQRVSADHLGAVLRQSIGKGFLAADLDAIQQEIAAQPWVATAQVRRQWPDTLAVTVTEEVPAARWGVDGLLNAHGRLFVRHVSHIPPELPRLSGPEGTEAEVAGRYVAIQEQLVERGLRIAALQLDDRGAWRLVLSNGIAVRLGSQNVDGRLARFYAALDEVVAPVAADVRFVDMRYTNGFSIGWKRPRV